MPDVRDLTGERLLDSYDAATRLAADGGLGLLSRPAFALQAEAARAELLRRLRTVDAVAARLNALVDADAVGLSTPAATAEIEALFRLTTTAAPPSA